MRWRWLILVGVLADAVLAIPAYRELALRRSDAQASVDVLRLGKALSRSKRDDPESYSVMGPHELGRHGVVVPEGMTVSVRCSADGPCYLRARHRNSATTYYFWDGEVYALSAQP